MKHIFAFITLASCVIISSNAKATSKFFLIETDESVNSTAADYADYGAQKGTFKNI